MMGGKRKGDISVFSFYTVLSHSFSPSPWLFPYLPFLLFLFSHPVPWCCPFLLLLLFVFHTSFLCDPSIVLSSSYSLLFYYFEVMFSVVQFSQVPLAPLSFLFTLFSSVLCGLAVFWRYIFCDFSLEGAYYTEGLFCYSAYTYSPPTALCPETNPGSAFRQTAALTIYLRLTPELHFPWSVFGFSSDCIIFNTVSSAAR